MLVRCLVIGDRAVSKGNVSNITITFIENTAAIVGCRICIYGAFGERNRTILVPDTAAIVGCFVVGDGSASEGDFAVGVVVDAGTCSCCVSIYGAVADGSGTSFIVNTTAFGDAVTTFNGNIV